MAHETSIENDGSKVVTRYYGAINSSEVFMALKERFSDVEKTKKYKVVISDFTDVVESELHDFDVEKLERVFRQAASHNDDMIYIGIMPSDLQFGLGRMWEDGYSHGVSLVKKIVRSREEASAFLESYQKKA